MTMVIMNVAEQQNSKSIVTKGWALVLATLFKSSIDTGNGKCRSMLLVLTIVFTSIADIPEYRYQ